MATLAGNGRTFIAAWTTPTGIRVSRIDGGAARMGVPLGGGPTADAPAIAAHADGYVIGWNDGVRFLDANGNLLGGPVSVGMSTPRSRVASNGSAVMLAYPRATFQFEILAAFIAPSGEVLKRDVRVGSNPGWSLPSPSAPRATRTASPSPARTAATSRSSSSTSKATCNGSRRWTAPSRASRSCRATRRWPPTAGNI